MKPFLVFFEVKLLVLFYLGNMLGNSHAATNIRFRVSGRTDYGYTPFAKVWYKGVCVQRTETKGYTQYPRWDKEVNFDYDEESLDQLKVELTHNIEWDFDEYIGTSWSPPDDIHMGVERELWSGSRVAGIIVYENVRSTYLGNYTVKSAVNVDCDVPGKVA